MSHRPLQDAENAQLMYDILRSPDEHYDAVRRFSSSLILSVVFGKRAPRFSTKEVTDFYHVQHMSYPPVDQVPILKYVPEMFAKWKRVCREVHDLQHNSYSGLLEETEKRGFENGCYMETILRRAAEWGLDREMVGYLGGALIEGGSDITSSFTNSMILALIAFPDAQRKAHEELDRVIGRDRAPEWEDLEDLPYIRALYRGYKIPKDSAVIINVWGIFHDPEVYNNPEIFNPDRYMESEIGTKKSHENDIGQRNDLSFGGGRRVCAGIHVAKYSATINAMHLLWAFDFSPSKNAKGEEIKPDVWDYAQALSASPNPFKCTIRPRSTQHAEIIRQRFTEATAVLKQFEYGEIKDAA
ncbi:cytochrome P450 [Irpex rosettiformis]|uniref:Cytochrome P450 n=1 Tax=Irpex rosettiformis TaxID=378272 RepID=A0ACB8U2X4_9APHY|nr:cytochrome P450 [Irpex rosettiformis]